MPHTSILLATPETMNTGQTHGNKQDATSRNRKPRLYRQPGSALAAASGDHAATIFRPHPHPKTGDSFALAARTA
jgi:hypothetical protein